jgi:hypothetical protein
MVRQYVGRYYSIEGSMKPVPVNLLALYVRIVGQKLISQNPRFALNTWDQGGRAVIATMERWVNKEVTRMRLGNTIGRSVIDSLFAFGIVKVALATPADSAISGWRQPAGKVGAWVVDFDDFVFDVHAKDFSSCGYMGHRFRVPLRVIKDSKLYSKDRKNLGPMPDRLFNLEGDERINMIGRTTLGGDKEEFEDFVDLWEIYLPKHGLILTLLDDEMSGMIAGSTGKALRIQKWIGPDSGPYHILGLDIVPGNVRPKSPLHDLFDLHMIINNMARKLMRQGQRMKEIMLTGGGPAANQEDAEKITKMSDGDAGYVSNPDACQVKQYGVPNPQLYQLFTAFKELFSWLAGNLEVMGGLAPQGKTASQDQLMNQNSSATISSMQGRVLDHVADIGRSMCWYWHHDPLKVMRSSWNIPGSKQSIPTYSYPGAAGRPDQQRHRIPFEDMDIIVDPYSLQYQTPQQRLQAVNSVVTGVFQPLAQLCQQQGIALDMNAYFNLAAKYLDQPDIPHILTTVNAPPQETQSPGDSGPAETTRNYERRSTGGQTPQGTMQEIGNQMSKAAASRNGDLQTA